ncbi:hypothetical protein [Thiohalomonas denitrificans]|uniref:hypothetical protein n=1 Tax=Thiohalomonas denitrificans TaxID=415747 RepID=UPI0026EEB3D1|nr:hypothetical protein [Thiohalomonas denitrificans]
MVDTVEESVAALEEDLGLPKAFLDSLKNEDDWSFIIKLHALVEAAVSHLLVHKFGDERLLSIFSRVELSNKATGKIAFISAMELVNKHERRFIRSLSELRNKLVHNIGNVQFDLATYADNLEKDAKDNFAKSFWYGYGEQDDGVDRKQLVLAKPKEAIWVSALLFLAIIYELKEAERLRSKANAMAVEVARYVSKLRGSSTGL